MAAGEDQAEAVVDDAFLVDLLELVRAVVEVLGNRAEGGIEAGPAADVVDRLDRAGS